mgnify:CR=1 FL=1
MGRGIAARGNRPGEFEPHQGAELEAVAGTGRHDPAAGGPLLDEEPFVLGYGVEADFQPVGAPAVEAAQQAAAFNWFVNAQSPAHGPARWVLAAATCPPADLRLREDLRTRLGWGHVFQLQALSETERRAVLRRAADERGVFLSDEVMDFMLRRFSRDLSSLMMLLDQLDGYALRTQRAITIPLIKSMLENE